MQASHYPNQVHPVSYYCWSRSVGISGLGPPTAALYHRSVGLSVGNQGLIQLGF